MSLIQLVHGFTRCPDCGASVERIEFTDTSILVTHIDKTNSDCEFVPQSWVIEMCTCPECQDGVPEFHSIFTPSVVRDVVQMCFCDECIEEDTND